MIFLLILIIGTAIGYDLKCPAKAEWRLKANVSCNSQHKYVCLFNVLEEKYMENCLGSDQSSIGSKLVFQPLFNLAECNPGRYQPIVFTTHGNSECIYSNSKCTGEGQVIFNNDSSSRDVTCRCDYTKGYAFVTKPKNSCFCIPSEEDCSCFRVTCTKLSPDYQCITNKEMFVNVLTCQEILSFISYDTDSNTAQFIGSNIKSHSNSQRVADIVIASIAVYFVLAVVVLLKFVVLVPPEIISQEIVESEGRTFEPTCYVKSHLPLTSVIWCKEPGERISTDINSENFFSRNGIRTLTSEILEKNELASYKCIASNIIGTVESDPVHINDDERQKIIHKLFQKGERGKLHFARLVFIGKNGVGKTSLMRRLLWHDKEEIPLIQSTDGIDVEKCNINIADGKWSPCNEADDDVRRMIRQVFKEKMLNVEHESTETVDDQEPFDSNKDESGSISDKELFKSSDEIDDLDIFNDDHKSESNTIDDTADIRTFISDNRNNHVAVVTDLDQVQQDNLKLKNVNDSEINNFTKTNKSEPVNDEEINKMTSTIMKSCLKFREKKQDDRLAFCMLWDFAGQKDYYATHQVFLSKHAVFLLVTNSLEFTTTENQEIDFEGSAQYVSFWFDAIHCYWSTKSKDKLDPPIIVVCTNEDQIKVHSEREKRQQQFKVNLGRVLKDQEKKRHLRNIYFISNTEDADNVFEDIRTEISRQAMDMEDWGLDCPLKWLLFQQVLLKLKDNNIPISSTETLMKIAKHEGIGISEENEIKRCLEYCNDNGTVIYFDEKNLEDYVVLDPKWLINAFRCLVSDKIDNIIEVSDDWQTLTDTGQLTDSLISLLFKKEPELQFEENKAHLIEVMKRFDIIVTLKNSTALYMPCMIKSGSFSEVQKQVWDENQPFYKTSWLCLEFKFLPPAFFNHIIAWYIKQYQVHVIIDKENRSKRTALYRHIGIFDLDLSCCEQLVVCEGPNVIAIQVWDLRMSNKSYGDLKLSLYKFVETLRTHYSLHISYTSTFTCPDGDFKINRKNLKDLVTDDYLCSEHKTIHMFDDLVKPWNDKEHLLRRRNHGIDKGALEWALKAIADE